MASRKNLRACCFRLPLLLTGVSQPRRAETRNKERLNAEEEIVVTGSRIHRKDPDDASPVRVITREQIDQAGASPSEISWQLMPSRATR